ncbi:hypothetical protein B0H11DRAFT_1977498 [Mycena galericulata]|nr:hypothetical protein B0H11DRAFT_1977498 [Mycena galericulata]
MTTTAHTIYSHYDPAQRKRLERETGQIPQEIDSAEEWDAEANLTFKRQLAPPPRFVPAASDFRLFSLTQTTNSAGPSRASSSSPATAGSSTQAAPRKPERRSKNNWFIMSAIAAEPAPAPPTASVPSTLADILARDPPPLPHESQYSPPVWLALGPANKGFTMLQNTLGPDVARRPTSNAAQPLEMLPTDGRQSFKEEVLNNSILNAEDGVQQIHPNEIIDLTMSDSDSSEESDAVVAEDNVTTSAGAHTEGSLRKVLVTPIATVLKSDRLGIGLKAKTMGPYKASQKRITHNAAAMLAHAKASEELRKEKKRNGRGHRAFARRRKVEEANRKVLLAYMNE